MLETTNNMLAAHSAMKQKDNRPAAIERKSSDKFSDHVSAADNKPARERQKTEEAAPREDSSEPAPRKQNSEKPAKKEETGTDTEAGQDTADKSEAGEKEAGLETAVLLLTRIQDVVEKHVEFVQPDKTEISPVVDQQIKPAEVPLADIGNLLGGDGTLQQNEKLPAEVISALQAGQQQANSDSDKASGKVLEGASGELARKPGQEILQSGQQKSGNADNNQAEGDKTARVADPKQNADAAKKENGDNAGTNNKEQQIVKDTVNPESTEDRKNRPKLTETSIHDLKGAKNGLLQGNGQQNQGLAATQGNQALHTGGQASLGQNIVTTHHAPQVPLNAVALHIAAQAQNGAKRFDIQLDPPELGRIDVRLDVAKDGTVQTHIFVERSETLDLMQRDSRALERALSDAGLNMKEGNLQFSLKGDGFRGSGFGQDESGSSSRDKSDIEEVNVDIDQIISLYRQSGGSSGIDIRV